VYIKELIPVDVGSMAYVCGCLIAGIAGYIPAEGVDVRLWCV